MKTLKKIGIVIISIIVLLVVVSFFLPSKMHVQRSMVMNASAENVYYQINTLKNWEKWSPWHKKDSAMKLIYEGPAEGIGAKYTWESEVSDVGKGNLSIKDSKPDETIVCNMVFGNMNQIGRASCRERV